MASKAGIGRMIKQKLLPSEENTAAEDTSTGDAYPGYTSTVALQRLKKLIYSRQKLNEWPPYQTFIYGPAGRKRPQ